MLSFLCLYLLDEKEINMQNLKWDICFKISREDFKNETSDLTHLTGFTRHCIPKNKGYYFYMKIIANLNHSQYT